MTSTSTTHLFTRPAFFFFLSQHFIRTFSLLFMDIFMARLTICRVDIFPILAIMKLRIWGVRKLAQDEASGKFTEKNLGLCLLICCSLPLGLTVFFFRDCRSVNSEKTQRIWSQRPILKSCLCQYMMLDKSFLFSKMKQLIVFLPIYIRFSFPGQNF